MKKVLFLLAGLALSLSSFAKDIQMVVLTTTPQMHCASCENRIKNGMKFETGVKDIVTSVPDQTVTVKYDADKTTPAKLMKAMEKVGYNCKVVNPGEKVEVKPAGHCNNM